MHVPSICQIHMCRFKRYFTSYVWLPLKDKVSIPIFIHSRNIFRSVQIPVCSYGFWDKTVRKMWQNTSKWLYFIICLSLLLLDPNTKSFKQTLIYFNMHTHFLLLDDIIIIRLLLSDGYLIEGCLICLGGGGGGGFTSEYMFFWICVYFWMPVWMWECKDIH